MNRNDTNHTQINITEDGIAWPEDLQLYKQPKGYQSFQWTNITNGINFLSEIWSEKVIKIEHFMVWMRPAGLPQFRKLWGVIKNGLNKGTYSIRINNSKIIVYDMKQLIIDFK